MKAAVYYRSSMIRSRRPYARRYPNGAGKQYFLEKLVGGLLAAATGLGAVTALLFLITMV